MLERVKNSVGADESGTGAFAGPFVVACVSLPYKYQNESIQDSKTIKHPLRRLELAREIEARANFVHLEYGHVSDINKYGLKAVWLRSIKRIYTLVRSKGYAKDEIYLDGAYQIGLPQGVRCIPQGDGKYMNIAAASIVAKVATDDYMMEISDKYPQYGFDKNLGYGTNSHRTAIQVHGPCPEHRTAFLKTSAANMLRQDMHQ